MSVPEPVVVITGGASGIGLETARRLARDHRVALLDRDADLVGEAARGLGADALGVPCDITDAASVARAVDAVVERLGRIDVAVSCAGVATNGVLRHLDPDVLAVQLDVNLTGNWRFVHACLPHLERSRGYVLGVASGAAIMGPPGEGCYAASKAGLEALLDVLRLEVADLGVDVGVAYLLFIDTPMVREGDAQHPDLVAVRRRLPGAAHRTFPVSLAGDLLAAGIRRRAARVFVPRRLRLHYILRGVLHPVLDRRLRRIGPEADRLTAAKVAERGPFAAAFNRQDARVKPSHPAHPADGDAR